MKKTMKKRVMDFIADYTRMHGDAPSYREIGAAVGLKSPSSVKRYIERLKNEEKLVAVSRRSRKLALARNVCLDRSESRPQRVRLEVADGGVVYLDCRLEKSGDDSVSVSFSGIFDASQIRGKVGQVVNCRIDDCM